MPHTLLFPFYIDPSQSVSKESGIGTKEGWITRIFKRFENDDNRMGTGVYEALRQHNIVGLEV
ncbi:unnamed protein product, partial [marine sediment metagenome]